MAEGAASVPPAQVPIEEALRKRVEDLYVLLQLGRWDQAEAYMTADSRENFRKQPKATFFGFKVDSINVDPGGRQAVVKVRVEQMVAQLGATPMPAVQTSHWFLVDNAWYMAFPDPAELDKEFHSLFKAPGNRALAPPEQLKFKGHRYFLGKIQPGQIKVAHFHFTNVTDHIVTLTSVDTGCPCLEVKTDKKEFKPGEAGEMAIAFNPAGYEREYVQTILVKTDPNDLTTRLIVAGFVMPQGFQSRKPPAKSKPGP